MKLKGKSLFIICISLITLLANMNIMNINAASKQNVPLTITDHGIKDAVNKPSVFEQGQIWTNKAVKDLGDGSFTITLSITANPFDQHESAFQTDSDIIITDEIGNGFEVKGKLPSSLKQKKQMITWKLSSSDLATKQLMKKEISFDVVTTASNAGTYYTNQSASATFTPDSQNPYYAFADKQSVSDKTAAITQTLKTTGYVTMKKNDKKATSASQATTYYNDAKQFIDVETLSSAISYVEAGPLMNRQQPFLQQLRSNLLMLLNDETIKKSEGIETDKTAAYDKKTGTASIDLEAFITGKVISNAKPSDIVLVLDQSGSMKDSKNSIDNYEKVYNLSNRNTYYILESGVYKSVKYNRTTGWTNNNKKYIPLESANDQTKGAVQFYNKSGKITRISALKNAATSFISSIEEDAKENKVDHKISIMGFASEKDYGNNTEVLSVEGKNSSYDRSNIGVIYSKATSDTYKKSWQSINSNSGKTMLNNAIKAIDAEGATRTDLGMLMAEQALAQADTDPDRNKVVVVFTDGVPTSFSDFDKSVADDALKSSYNIKSKHAATVYSIGISNGANPTTKISNYNRNDSDTTNLNRFLHLLSCNYTDAASASLNRNFNNDTINPNNEGYYLTAANANDLYEIFDNIYDQIQPDILLDANAVLRDTISDYFTFTESTKVNVYQQAYTGNQSDGSRQWGALKAFQDAEVSRNGKQISVKGFDYKENMVYNDSEGPHGSKLVVKITGIKPIPGFIGGNQVPTNGNDSGVYDGKNSLVEHFDRPVVDVPLVFDFKTSDRSIYLGDTWRDVEQFLQNQNQKLQYLINQTAYDFGGKRNDFVNIVYNIKHGNTTVATYTVHAKEASGTLSNITLDTSEFSSDAETFTISANVTPTHTGTAASISTTDKQSILYIYKPVLHVSDDTIFYGEKEVLSKRLGLSNVEWNCAISQAPLPLTPKPQLQASLYDVTNKQVIANNQEALLLTDTTQYKASISREDTAKDISAHTLIKNISAKNDQDDKHDFTVYVVKGQLDITKSINAQYTNESVINANQSFVFKIERKDVQNGDVKDVYYQTIAFSANDVNNKQKTISVKGLKKGYYTITEMEEWSWRYQLNASSSNAINNHYQTKDIFIGEKDVDELPYFGTQDKTMLYDRDISNPATCLFKNIWQQQFENLLGDVASAINKFNQ